MSLVKIKDLFHFEKGTLQSTKATPGEYDFITAAADWKTHNEYTHDCEALIFAVAASGSLGRTHYVNGKFISSDLCFILTPKNEEEYPIDIQFYHLIFNAFKEDIVRDTKSGTSKEAIGLTVFGNYEIPYFDIKRQLETKELFIQAQEISQSIDYEFEKQLELLEKLRQSLMNDALRGKLVSHKNIYEPASKQLKIIRDEKERLIKEKLIKRGKLQEAETQEELLFEIPKHWEWCKLDDISKNITDGTHQTPTYTNSGRMFLSAQNIKPFKFMPENHKYVSEEAYQSYIKNRKPEKGDLLIGRVGAGIGETAVIDQDLDFCIYVSLGLVQPFKEFVDSNYLAYVFNSPYGYRYAKGNISSKGGSAGNFNLGRIRSFLIPFPPLQEQKEIVSKLDETINYCNSLESQIKFNKELNKWILQRSLRESLGLKNQTPKPSTSKNSTDNIELNKYDSTTLLMEIKELLKIHGKLQALELWQMSKFYGKTDEERNIDGFYAELKKLIEKEKVVKETEKGYLELV